MPHRERAQAFNEFELTNEYILVRTLRSNRSRLIIKYPTSEPDYGYDRYLANTIAEMQQYYGSLFPKETANTVLTLATSMRDMLVTGCVIGCQGRDLSKYTNEIETLFRSERNGDDDLTTIGHHEKMSTHVKLLPSVQSEQLPNGQIHIIKPWYFQKMHMERNSQLGINFTYGPDSVYQDRQEPNHLLLEFTHHARNYLTDHSIRLPSEFTPKLIAMMSFIAAIGIANPSGIAPRRPIIIRQRPR